MSTPTITAHQTVNADQYREYKDAIIRVRDLLEITVPDGILDHEHATKIADRLVREVTDTLKLSVHQHVTVSWIDPERSHERMQAQGRADAHEIAERMQAQPGVDRATCHHRYCTPWHRTP